MGLCNSPDIFQQKMNKLFHDLEYVRAYIDDLLIISKSNFEDQLNKVKLVFKETESSWFQNQCRKILFN